MLYELIISIDVKKNIFLFMTYLSLKIDFFEELSLVIEENNVIENKNKDCGIFGKK